MSEFPVGSKLLGHLIDFDESTPETQVTLERTSDSILLSLTWTASDGAYSRWFWTTQNGPVANQGVPSRLLFIHDRGAILLVGCQNSSSRGGSWGPGMGVVSATHAILDVFEDIDYEKLNGLRSVIPGLRSWLGITSVRTSIGPPNGSEPLAATYIAQEGLPLVIGGPNRLRLVPTWRAVPNYDEDTITLFDEVVCESTNSDLQDWPHFLSEHRAIRDLLLLSSWTSLELSARAAFRLEADITADGNASQSGSWRSRLVAELPGLNLRRSYGGHGRWLVHFSHRSGCELGRRDARDPSRMSNSHELRHQRRDRGGKRSHYPQGTTLS